MASESISEAWERLQEYEAACPHHGMGDWLVLQCFYNGLSSTSRAHLDAASAGGAFLDKTIAEAKQLIKKMVSNQGWNDEHSSKGKHTVKEADMLAAKLDALIKCIDDQEKARSQAVHAVSSFQLCEVCNGNGHSRNDCPETHKDVAFMNNNNFGGYRPQQPNWNQPQPQYQGGNNFNSNFNQPPLKEIVINQGKIIDALSKKFSTTDKSLESINNKLEGFFS